MTRKTKQQLIDETITEARKLEAETARRKLERVQERDILRKEQASRYYKKYNAEKAEQRARTRLEQYPADMLARLLMEARLQLHDWQDKKAKFEYQVDSVEFEAGKWRSAPASLERAQRNIERYVGKIRLIQEIIMAKRERSDDRK